MSGMKKDAFAEATDLIKKAEEEKAKEEKKTGGKAQVQAQQLSQL